MKTARRKWFSGLVVGTLLIVGTLLCFPAAGMADSARFARTEGNCLVLYELPVSFSGRNSQSRPVAVGRILLDQTIRLADPAHPTPQEIDRTVSILYKLQSVATFLTPEMVRFVRLPGVSLPGLASARLGYTEEAGWNFYFYLEGELGYALFGKLMSQMYMMKMMTGQVGVVRVNGPENRRIISRPAQF